MIAMSTHTLVKDGLYFSGSFTEEGIDLFVTWDWTVDIDRATLLILTDAWMLCGIARIEYEWDIDVKRMKQLEEIY